LIDSAFSSVVCAPVYTRRDGLHTQVDVGIEEGLKHESCIHCDELMSLAKVILTDFVGALRPAKLIQLDRALAFAVGLTASTIAAGR
jgi:mRNA interferase MazF